MSVPLLFLIALLLTALAFFVLRAQPREPVNVWFACLALSAALWSLALGLAHSDISTLASVRIAFAAASVIPATCVGLAHSFPVHAGRYSRHITVSSITVGTIFALLSLLTPLVVSDATFTHQGLRRTPGILYPVFGLYVAASFVEAAILFVSKWRSARGLTRTQLQYLAAGIIFSGIGGMITNLLLPLLTGRSTHTWAGPSFSLLMAAVVAHAIIRHRLMDLRLVIHRGLTSALALFLSLIPVAVVMWMFWGQLSNSLKRSELLVLAFTITLASLLAPPIRDLSRRLLNRYVYRTHANYQRTVLDASEALTRVLDQDSILLFIRRALTASLEPEGVGIYVVSHSGFECARAERRHDRSAFQTPQSAPDAVVQALTNTKRCIVTDEVLRKNRASETRDLHQELTRLNWALVLPLLSEDSVIGAIVVGPKLSGDAFYPQDLDLLMTLANQAGIAIKNAQLYTEVVLANEYIENIVATIETGVLAVNASGHVTRFNRAASQLTALAADEVVGRPVDALPEALSGLVGATLADGQERTEPEIALPGGPATRPVICTTSPLRDPAGAILGAVAVFSDLTPLKQLELERRRVERLAYFEILASSIGHEIKNPLVAIKTFAQLIPRRHLDEHFVDEFSRVVTREIGRMERLVERLRTLSRPSDRPKHRVDVRGPLNDAVEFLRPTFLEKRIQLTARFGAEPRVVLGEPGELEQLFLNLLMNAYEATPPDGAVDVGIDGAPQQIVVTIADSGPGFQPEMLEHVFDPFITSKPRGSGLGLTISAGIAAAHRAKLRAANRPDGGALLTVEFPIAALVEAAVSA